MKYHTVSNIREKIYSCCLAFSAVAFLSGCMEVNVAVDNILGRTAMPAVVAVSQVSETNLMLAKKREPGAMGTEKQSGPSESVNPPAAPGKSDAPPASAKSPEAAPKIAEGKRRAPGALSPGEEAAAKAEQELASREGFTVSRDPFKAPTEILPSECPPSMPLCRFDRSQLKLRGVIQLSDGQFKGMVEDPDGRGYFVTPGMKIGGATVTQITTKGVILFVHKTRQDVIIPLFVEAKESKEF